MSANCCRDSSRIVDNGEGLLVCSTCGMVQGAVLTEDISSRVAAASHSIERACRRALEEFGFKFRPELMTELLLDWSENGLLPRYIVEKTVFRGTRILSEFQWPELGKKRLHCSLTEFAAIVLYGTLIEEKIPRSAVLLSTVSGVSAKRLWNLDGIFFPDGGATRMLSPSDWMPGLCYYLPTKFKENRKICYVSDLLAEEFGFRPLTILSVAIYAFLEMRSAKFPSEKGLTKRQLCDITGVSVSTLTRGLNEIFGKGPPPYCELLRSHNEVRKKGSAF